MAIIVREFSDMKRDPRGEETNLVYRVLATDQINIDLTLRGYPASETIKTAASGGFVKTTARTHFIEIESTADVRVAVAPKEASAALPATANHTLVKAGVPTILAVHPGGYVSFL